MKTETNPRVMTAKELKSNLITQMASITETLQWCSRQYLHAILINLAYTLVFCLCIFLVFRSASTESREWIFPVVGMFIGAGLYHSYKVKDFIDETVSPLSQKTKMEWELIKDLVDAVECAEKEETKPPQDRSTP